MTFIWSYILMVLCLAMTSAKVINFPSNRNSLHNNANLQDVEEKVLAPPFSHGLNIDSDGYRGNSNGNEINEIDCKKLCFKEEEKESCLCHWPNFLKEIFIAMEKHSNESKNYQIIPFSKEDIINLEGSPLCRIMCINGVHQPPCKC